MKILILNVMFPGAHRELLAVGVDRQALEREAGVDATGCGLPQPVFDKIDTRGVSTTPVYHCSPSDYYYMIAPLPWCGPDPCKNHQGSDGSAAEIAAKEI